VPLLPLGDLLPRRQAPAATPGQGQQGGATR